jgi:hypothetical protein
MAAYGRVSKRFFGEEGRTYHHAIEFGFEFDPTVLPTVLSAFVTMGRESRSNVVSSATEN